VSTGLPWLYVGLLVGALTILLVGWVIAVLTIRFGIRTHEELTRRIMAERVVEREEAQAERDVAERGEAERAAAGRDDQREG
jgi:hypothetical protein